MCGTTSLMISPSDITSSRNTPCVDGCCGPRLMIISSERRSASRNLLGSEVSRLSSLKRYWILFCVTVECSAITSIFYLYLTILFLLGIIFSKGESVPVGRHQDTSQVGM